MDYYEKMGISGIRGESNFENPGNKKIILFWRDQNIHELCA